MIDTNVAQENHLVQSSITTLFSLYNSVSQSVKSSWWITFIIVQLAGLTKSALLFGTSRVG
jgi:hypothetical protein